MEQIVTTPPPETPAPPMSLREHIAVEEAPPTPPVTETKPPATEAKPAVTEPPAVTAEQEAESAKPDAELSEAGRTLRKNRADARKARIQQEIDDLTARKHAAAREIEDLERKREALRSPAPTPASTPGVDPSDPRPTYETYAAAHPDDTDPYAGFLLELNRWDRRQEQKQADAQRQRATVDESARAIHAKLSEHAGAGRKKFSDFDVITEPVFAALQGNPRDADVAAFVASSPVGDELVYRLGKASDALQAVITASTPAQLHRELARIELSITAPTPEPKPVTTAPPPPSQTVGSQSTVQTLDTRAGVPLKDHIRIEEAEIAERRRQGHRY